MFGQGSLRTGLTLIVWEVVLHRANGKLLLEPVDLVEEKNDGGLDEPPRIANRVEKCQGFLHTVDGLIFKEQLIVFRNSDQEEDSGDVLEAMDPLLPLRTLATDVEHAIREVSDDKSGLRDTSSLHTRTENILVVGQVIRGGDTIDGVKVARNGISMDRSTDCDGETYYLAESLS